MLKISYTVWKKHGDNYYCRVRERGVQPLDINLHTTNKAQAEAFILLRKRELELYNAQLLAGEPADASKLLRRSTHLIAQKGASEGISVMAAADAWEMYLRRSGKRPRSIETYLKSLKNTIDFAIPLSALTDKVINQSLAKHDHLKSATRKSYGVALREFVKFCVKEYGINRDLIDCFIFVKVDQEEKGYWTPQQVRRIIDKVECRDERTTQCYKAYFWFLFQTGCRQGEGGLVEWDDIKDGMVTIRAENTKGGKTRRVALTLGMLDLLAQLPHVSKLVFAYISTHQASRFSVLARAVKLAEVPHGGLHTFRHSASMYLYSKIADIKLVSQMLGHSPSVALQYYQRTRESDKVADAVKQAFAESVDMPSLNDKFIEGDLW